MRVGLRVFGCDSQTCGYPWSLLASTLAASGLEVSDVPPVEFFVAVDHCGCRSCSRLIAGSNTAILLRLEPRVVHPEQYSERVTGLYKLVWDVGSQTAILQEPSLPFRPVLLSRPTAVASWHERPFFAGLLAANKNSLVPDSEYALRRAVIEESATRGVRLTVGGSGWRMSIARSLVRDVRLAFRLVRLGQKPVLRKVARPLSAKARSLLIGQQESKFNFWQHCQRGLVIENERTYISEKLFDVLASGAVPFYVGPQLGSFGLPNLAIECPPDACEIIQRVEETSVGELLEIRKNGLEWLGSADAEVWRPQSSFTEIVRALIAAAAAS